MAGVEVNFQGSPSIKLKTSKIKAIFISYADINPKNEYLVERLVRNFLKKLGFEVFTYKDSKSSIPLIDEINLFISESPVFLGFLQKILKTRMANGTQSPTYLMKLGAR